MKPRIVIVVEGGLIQHILGNTADVEIATIDYDTEGAEEDRLTPVPQTDNTTTDAFCFVRTAPDEIDGARVEQLFTAILGE